MTTAANTTPVTRGPVTGPGGVGSDVARSVGGGWHPGDDHRRGASPMSSQASPNPRPTRLMQAALDAAAAGLYVFPVWPKGKRSTGSRTSNRLPAPAV